MIAGLAAVAVASVVGSLHCAAMCGPLMAMHLRGPEARRDLALHHAGRAAGYMTLGGIAGAVGKLVDLAGAALALQRAALGIAVIGLVGSGVVLAVRALRWRRVVASSGSRTTLTPQASQASQASPAPSLFSRGLVQLRARRPRPRSTAPRALAMGMLHALLPCGWLWAFVALAAGTGSPLAGAAAMFAFWLGTLPALVGVTALAAPLFSRLRPRWPLVTAALMLGLAGAALLLRVPLIAPRDAEPAAAPSCHAPAHSPPALPALEEVAR